MTCRPLGVTNIRTFVDPQIPTRIGVLMDVSDMDAVVAAKETDAAAKGGGVGRSLSRDARYEVLDNPDLLIEIAEWESAEARVAHMEESAATGAYAPLLEVLATPFRATVVKQLP